MLRFAPIAAALLLAGCSTCGTEYFAQGYAAVIVEHPDGERFVAALPGVDPDELEEAVGDEDDWVDLFALEGVYLRWPSHPETNLAERHTRLLGAGYPDPGAAEFAVGLGATNTPTDDRFGTLEACGFEVTRVRLGFSSELTDDDQMTEDTGFELTLDSLEGSLALRAEAALHPDAPQEEGGPWSRGTVVAQPPLEADTSCDVSRLSFSIHWAFAEEESFVRHVGCYKLRDRI